MRRKISIVYVIAVVLLLCTAGAAVLHLCGQAEVSSGTVMVETSGGERAVSLKGLTLRQIEGTRTNGKGETTSFQGEGVPLSEVLLNAGVDLDAVTQIHVRALDEFSADVLREELTDGANLILQEDETLELIMFGDKDRKRNVKNVVRLIVE